MQYQTHASPFHCVCRYFGRKSTVPRIYREMKHRETIVKMGIYNTRLHWSIVGGHNLSVIRAHVENVPDINFQCKTRLTALQTAVKLNNVEVVTLLLHNGANMMLLPLKSPSHNGVKCALLMALHHGQSHEGMQLVLLDVLFKTRRDEFDSASLSILAKISQYAMAYSTPRVFFAARQVEGALNVVKSSGYNPLMFTIVNVGYSEEEPENCSRVMHQVLEIVDKDSSMSWERYRCKKTGVSKSRHDGATALGMLIFDIVVDRTKRCQVTIWWHDQHFYLAGG